jgi:4-aminobutyrate aminotransferase / (S)-3-amino-2-methylpropionate transaminase / 5-aminovalerate transaminase
MAVQVSGSKTQALMAKRDAYVARGVSLAPIVPDHAHGARLTDVDGKEYIDFAGGIGVLNLGHTPDAVVDAIKRQAETMLHSCFPVAAYEPYLEVAQLLCENSPGSHAKKALLINSGAEAVENAVKIARYHTGRDAVITFDRGFHGRTLLTMTLTSKLVYKKGMGPFAPEVYRAPAPYPYRGVTTEDALKGLEFMFKAHVDPQAVACMVLEPVQGEGGFTVMPAEFIEGVMTLCQQHGIVYIDDEVQSGMGRTGKLWALDHYDLVPDLMTVGKSLAAGMPLAGVVGRADIIDSVHPGGLGSTYGGNPVACAAAVESIKAIASPEFLAHATSFGEEIMARLHAMAERHAVIGEVRGIGPMAAIELVKHPDTREPASDVAAATVAGALERGLLLLKTGIYDNVLRILVPITATEEDLNLGLDRLEESLAAAA